MLLCNFPKPPRRCTTWFHMGRSFQSDICWCLSLQIGRICQTPHVFELYFWLLCGYWLIEEAETHREIPSRSQHIQANCSAALGFVTPFNRLPKSISLFVPRIELIKCEAKNNNHLKRCPERKSQEDNHSEWPASMSTMWNPSKESFDNVLQIKSS